MCMCVHVCVAWGCPWWTQNYLFFFVNREDFSVFVKLCACVCLFLFCGLQSLVSPPLSSTQAMPLTSAAGDQLSLIPKVPYLSRTPSVWGLCCWEYGVSSFSNCWRWERSKYQFNINCFMISFLVLIIKVWHLTVVLLNVHLYVFYLLKLLQPLLQLYKAHSNSPLHSNQCAMAADSI